MRNKITTWLGLAALGSALAVACTEDEDIAAGSGGTAGRAGSAGQGGSGGSAQAGSAGQGGNDETAMVARGEYLVRHVAACVDCHTPRDEQGKPVMSKFMSGGPFADIDPTDDTKGMIFAPNLTPHATGLANWTDAQIKDAFLNGRKADGTALVPAMPYYVLHNMSAEDADAIVAYLRSIPAIDNAIPARQDLGFPYPNPAPPVPADKIPNSTLGEDDPNYASAQRGKYLAGNIGICMECHTEEAAGFTINADKLFAGGKSFPAAAIGVTSPPFPAAIVTPNLTPDATGIQDWTAEDVKNALHQGIEPDGNPICPPMPAGAMQAFGGLTDEDALAIGHYLTTLPKQVNTVPECNPGEGGGGGAGGDGGE